MFRRHFGNGNHFEKLRNASIAHFVQYVKSYIF